MRGIQRSLEDTRADITRDEERLEATKARLKLSKDKAAEIEATIAQMEPSTLDGASEEAGERRRPGRPRKVT